MHKDIKMQCYRTTDEKKKSSLEKKIAVDIEPEIKDLEEKCENLMMIAFDSVDHKLAEMVLKEVDSITAYLDSKEIQSEPNDLARQLENIKEKLNEPGKAASAKLKIVLPIIPLIASYELELDTESCLIQSCGKIRSLLFGKKEMENSKDITIDEGFKVAGCIALAIQFAGLTHHEEEVIDALLKSEKIDFDCLYIGKWRDDIFLLFILDFEQAIKTATSIRDTLLYFDWRSKSVCYL